MNDLQTEYKTSSLYRLAQTCTLLLSTLYLIRGAVSVPVLGISFPIFLTIAVGLLLIPVVMLLNQPRRWLPNFILGISIIGLIANPTMMYLFRNQETTPIFVISTLVILLWAILFGIFCLPASRQISNPD